MWLVNSLIIINYYCTQSNKNLKFLFYTCKKISSLCVNRVCYLKIRNFVFFPLLPSCIYYSITIVISFYMYLVLSSLLFLFGSFIIFFCVYIYLFSYLWYELIWAKNVLVKLVKASNKSAVTFSYKSEIKGKKKE